MGAEFHFSFGCSRDLHDRIVAYAVEHGLSASQVVRRAVRALLESAPKTGSAIEESAPPELAEHPGHQGLGHVHDAPASSVAALAAEPEPLLPRTADEILDAYAPGWRDEPNPQFEAAMAKARERQLATLTDWRTVTLTEPPPRDQAERLWALLCAEGNVVKEAWD